MSNAVNDSWQKLKDRYESTIVPAETVPQYAVIFKKLLDLPPTFNKLLICALSDPTPVNTFAELQHCKANTTVLWTGFQ